MQTTCGADGKWSHPLPKGHKTTTPLDTPTRSTTPTTERWLDIKHGVVRSCRVFPDPDPTSQNNNKLKRSFITILARFYFD